MVSKQIQGKKNRANGAEFERRVRKDLEEEGWIVDKWSNNVMFYSKPEKHTVNILLTNNPTEDNIGIALNSNTGKITPAKARWNNFTKSMMMGSGGFPDFTAFKQLSEVGDEMDGLYEVIGVESKSNGFLKKIEKEKCQWYLDNKIFSKILIAKKVKIKNRVHIEYKEFNGN